MTGSTTGGRVRIQMRGNKDAGVTLLSGSGGLDVKKRVACKRL